MTIRHEMKLFNRRWRLRFVKGKAVITKRDDPKAWEAVKQRESRKGEIVNVRQANS